MHAQMTGNTENVASEIQKALGDKVGEPVEIADIGADGLTDYDGFIVGAPTWHTDADDNRSGTSWDDELANIAALDLNGKPCAIFGLGDSAGYADYFCDAIEEIHRTFASAGCTTTTPAPSRRSTASSSAAPSMRTTRATRPRSAPRPGASSSRRRWPAPSKRPTP